MATHALFNLIEGDVVFERPPLEGLYDDGYRALRADLEGLGWELTEVSGFELRNVPAESIEIAFRLLRDFGEEGYHEALALLVGLIFGRLRRPKRARAPKRTAVIYAASGGEILATVELDAPPDPSA